jgi:catechol 2,3-dioxygenase-like lactoylglutathione lyase family enzyme
VRGGDDQGREQVVRGDVGRRECMSRTAPFEKGLIVTQSGVDQADVIPTGKVRGVGPIHHTVLNVTDLERSIHFYGDLLDLHRTLESTVGGDAFEALLRLTPGTTARICYFDGGIRLGQIELVQWVLPPEAEPTTPSKAEQPKATDLQQMMISFQVAKEELAVRYAKLSEAGVTCWSEPTSLELPNYGEIRAFIAEDPDGHPIEFVSLPSREDAKAVHRSTKAEK